MRYSLRELSEKIQEDIITYCDGMDFSIVTDLCQIVVNNFSIKPYEIVMRRLHWECGDGCCSESWLEAEIFLIEEHKKTSLYTLDRIYGLYSYESDEEIIFNVINSIVDKHRFNSSNCDIVFE
jgi:hypothetical protein